MRKYIKTKKTLDITLSNPITHKLLSLHLVPPSVQAPSQLLGSPFGSNVELNCHVEASPAPVVYWLRGSRQRYDGTGIANLDIGQTRNEMLLDG